MSSLHTYNLKGTWFERMMDGKYKTILINVAIIVQTHFDEFSLSYKSAEELELDDIIDDALNAIKLAPAPQKIDILYDATHAMIDVANEELEAIYDFINSSPGFTKPVRRFIEKKPILAGLDKLIQEKLVKTNLTRIKGARNLLKTRRHMRKTRKSRKSRR
jgi:hypothetical protein